MNDAIDFILLLVILLVTRQTSLIIYELGHVFFALLLYRCPIQVYFGSYGDEKATKKIQTGRLTIFYHSKKRFWEKSAFYLDTTTPNANKSLIVALAGPSFSILLTLVIVYALIFSSLGVLIIIAFSSVLVVLFFDIYNKIKPLQAPILLNQQFYTYTSFQNAKIQFRLKDEFSIYHSMLQAMQKGKVQEALASFEKMTRQDQLFEVTILGISLYDRMKNSHKVTALYRALKNKNSLNSSHYAKWALTHSWLNEHKTALDLYTIAIKKDSKNFSAIYNRGYTYRVLKKYDKAILDFNSLINIPNDFLSSALSERGLSKILNEDVIDGLVDLDNSISIDSKNSYAYKNLGIYQLSINNKEKAKEYFDKAFALDPHTHGLNEYL